MLGGRRCGTGSHSPCLQTLCARSIHSLNKTEITELQKAIFPTANTFGTGQAVEIKPAACKCRTHCVPAHCVPANRPWQGFVCLGLGRIILLTASVCSLLQRNCWPAPKSCLRPNICVLGLYDHSGPETFSWSLGTFGTHESVPGKNPASQLTPHPPYKRALCHFK